MMLIVERSSANWVFYGASWNGTGVLGIGPL
jgi:hypothetical protein